MAAQPNIVTLSSSAPSSHARPSPSSHRLPTISASQALQNPHDHAKTPLSSGLKSFDSALSNDALSKTGGFERGKVTELWGPTGAGKTAIMLETAAKTLSRGDDVVWIDARSPVDLTRLEAAIIRHASSAPRNRPSELMKHFHPLRVPTLSHFLATILYPRPSFPPAGTSLLIISGLNTLLDLDYPRTLNLPSTRTPQAKWRASRRYAVLGAMISALNKTAALANLAVLVTTGCATRMRPDSGLGAALVPGVGGAEWDQGVWTRVVVFRDLGGRFVGVQKCGGRSLISREEVGEVGRVVAFEITRDGTLGEWRQPHFVRLPPSPVKGRKRAYDEIADSDGEDADEYGWADGDENVLAQGLNDDTAAESEENFEAHN